MEKVIIRSTNELESFLKDFNYNCFSFDTETTSLSYTQLEITHLQLCDGKKACVIIINPDLIPIIKQFFIKVCNSNGLIIAHNIVYDAKVLYKYDINILNTQWFDTMVAYHLLDEVDSYGLKYLANKFLGVETVEFKEARKDSQKFLEYSINDAIWTYQLFELFAPRLKEEGLEMLMRKIEMPFLRVIWMMETTGFLIDQERVETTTKEIKEELFEIERQMYTILGEPYIIQTGLDGSLLLIGKLNLNSSNQLGNILFDKLKLPEQGNTDTGNRKTGRDVIKALKGKHAFVDLLEKYKVARKLLTAFFDPLPRHIDRDGRVRSSFNDCGAKTGRLSCSDPNLQQLPKKNEAFPVDTRSCFIAPEGKKLIAADYSGQELRVLAHISKDKGLIDAFNSGKDFHQETADKFGVSRVQAKAINFGIAYGKGAYGFAKDWNCSEDEAQEFLDKYFSSFPKVKEAIEQTTKEVKDYGYVSNLVGRKRRFTKVKEDGNEFYRRSMFREAFNFKIQGFSADMMRVASIKVLNRSLRNRDWGLKILALVHDEIVCEINEDYAEIGAKCIKGAMESAVNLKVPVLADVNIGLTYSDVK